MVGAEGVPSGDLQIAAIDRPAMGDEPVVAHRPPGRRQGVPGQLRSLMVQEVQIVVQEQQSE